MNLVELANVYIWSNKGVLQVPLHADVVLNAYGRHFYNQNTGGYLPRFNKFKQAFMKTRVYE